MSLPPERRAALRARLAAATPGPWVAVEEEETCEWQEGNRFIQETYPVLNLRAECTDGDPHALGSHQIAENIAREADGAFIAHAREDVLDLLAALETAEARAAEAERERPAETPQAGGREAVIVYTNWRGERAERRIIPGSIWFGSTEWHRDEQYLLRAWDVEKEAVRDFALRDVREWRAMEKDDG